MFGRRRKSHRWKRRELFAALMAILRAHKKDGVTRPFCCLVFAGVYSQALRLQATQVVEHYFVVVFGLKAIKDVLHGALLIN